MLNNHFETFEIVIARWQIPSLCTVSITYILQAVESWNSGKIKPYAEVQRLNKIDFQKMLWLSRLEISKWDKKQRVPERFYQEALLLLWMASFPLVATEVWHKSKCFATSCSFTNIRTLFSVDTDMFSSCPCPLEGHFATFHRAFQGPVIVMNTPVLYKVFVWTKPFPTSFKSASIAFVHQQFLFC